VFASTLFSRAVDPLIPKIAPPRIGAAVIAIIGLTARALLRHRRQGPGLAEEP
jgi:hypothetical protein